MKRKGWQARTVTNGGAHDNKMRFLADSSNQKMQSDLIADLGLSEKIRVIRMVNDGITPQAAANQFFVAV